MLGYILPSWPVDSLFKWSKTTLGLICVAPPALLLLRHAAKQVAAALTDSPVPGQKKLAGYGAANFSVERLLFLPPDVVGVVIGRHGRNIQRIEFETRTFINVMTLGDERFGEDASAQAAFEEWQLGGGVAGEEEGEAVVPSAKHSFLRIRGSSVEQVKLAELGVEVIIREHRSRSSIHEFLIPASVVGLVIGRRGDTLRRMNMECRVYTRISQDSGEFETVRMEGSEEGIKAAEARILAIVDRATGNFQRFRRDRLVEDEFGDLFDEDLTKLLEENW